MPGCCTLLSWAPPVIPKAIWTSYNTPKWTWPSSNLAEVSLLSLLPAKPSGVTSYKTLLHFQTIFELTDERKNLKKSVHDWLLWLFFTLSLPYFNCNLLHRLLFYCFHLKFPWSTGPFECPWTLSWIRSIKNQIFLFGWRTSAYWHIFEFVEIRWICFSCPLWTDTCAKIECLYRRQALLWDRWVCIWVCWKKRRRMFIFGAGLTLQRSLGTNFASGFCFPLNFYC